jgi:hypothetical protein
MDDAFGIFSRENWASFDDVEVFEEDGATWASCERGGVVQMGMPLLAVSMSVCMAPTDQR